ncbi:tetratricopeptide repeat protein [Paroceanicella profunda]|nr:tetratricopeptide repeat protein [Paroceanicella profunda]
MTNSTAAPSGTGPGRALREAGRLLDAGRLAEAEARFSDVLTLRPGHVAALAGRITTALKSGHMELALSRGRDALKLRPCAVEVIAAYGEALIAAGQADQAVALLDRLPPRPRNTVPVRMLAATLAIRMADFARAETHFDAVLALEPGHVEASLGRIESVLRRDEADRAAALALNAVAAHPEDEKIVNRCAGVLRRGGRPREAARLLLRALRRAPRSARLRCSLAECYAELQRDEGADRHFSTVLAARPGHVAALLGRAELALRRGDFDGLMALLRAATEAHPQDRNCLQRAARLLARAGQHAAAVEVADTLVESFPDTAAHWLLSTRLNRELGNVTAVQEARSRAERLRGLRANDYHALAEGALLDGDVREALSAVARGLQAFPGSLRLRLMDVRILRRADRPGDVVRALRDMLRAHGTQAPVHAELGSFWLDQGKPAAALRSLARAVAINPEDRSLRAKYLRAALDCPAGAPVVAREVDALLAAETPRAADLPLIRCLAIEGAQRLGPDVLARLRGQLATLAPLLGERDATDLLTLADAAGDAAACERALARLVDCGPKSMKACRQLVILFRPICSDEGFRRLAARLMETIHPGLRAELDAEVALLDEGPTGALRRYRTHRFARRTLRQALLLLRLLSIAGERARALRYGRACLRRWPGDLAMLKAQYEVLMQQGRAQELDTLLDSAMPAGRRARATHLRLRARLLAEASRPDAALALFEQADRLDPDGARIAQTFDLMVTAGRLEEAGAQIGRMQGTADAPGLNIRHLSTTLSGNLLNDLRLFSAEAARAGPGAEADLAAQFVVAARRAIAQWMDRAPAAGPAQARAIPRRILQYWNTQDIPAPVRDVMRSWSAVDAASHRVWTREEARAFLSARFGAAHLRAFRLANHVAEEADFLRLCLLYAEGGLYADADDRLAAPDIFERLPAHAGLVCFREHRGSLSNNIIAARPGHPVIGRAKEMALEALLARDNDSAWSKTGPGVLTRAAAACLLDPAIDTSDLAIIQVSELRRMVQIHVPIPYKKTVRYWDHHSRTVSHSLRGLIGYVTSRPEAGNTPRLRDI